MQTVAYLFIFFALLLVRGAVKGRSLTDLPTDLGDFFNAIIQGDTKAIQEVLSRTGQSLEPIQAAGTGGPNVPANGLLAEMKKLGVAANNVYKWAATGPNAYDCSGLVWRAMKNLGIYNGPRFTSGTFGIVSKKFAVQVSDPQPNDVVVWRGHMGVVEGPNKFYSALSTRSGIKSASISGIGRGKPKYYRIGGSSGPVAGGGTNYEDLYRNKPRDSGR